MTVPDRSDAAMHAATERAEAQQAAIEREVAALRASPERLAHRLDAADVPFSLWNALTLAVCAPDEALTEARLAAWLRTYAGPSGIELPAEIEEKLGPFLEEAAARRLGLS